MKSTNLGIRFPLSVRGGEFSEAEVVGGKRVVTIEVDRNEMGP